MEESKPKGYIDSQAQHNMIKTYHPCYTDITVHKMKAIAELKSIYQLQTLLLSKPGF